MKIRIYLLLLLLLSTTVKAQEKKEAYVFFPLGSASISGGVNDNRVDLNELIEAINCFQADGVTTIEKIEISSYASPEGSRSRNNDIVEQRTNNVLNYIKRFVSLPESVYEINNIGIAWSELKEMVSKSDMAHRDKVIEIIDNIPEETWKYVNPTDRWLTLVDSRNKHLMDLAGGVPYNYMKKEFFPSLRSTSVVTVYFTRKEKIEEPVVVEVQPEEVVSQDTTEFVDIPDIEPQEIVTEPVKKVVSREIDPYFAVKTNLLFDALLMPNIEVEIPIGNRWSVAGEWMFPWWVTENNGNALQILAGNVEGRYWFGDRAQTPKLTGWFAGLYAGGGYYDLQWKNNGYQGEFFIAAGLSGGYAHTINKSGSLRMEYSIGVGYLQTDYRYYEGRNNNECLEWQYDGNYTWIGPTKIEVSLVWMINRKGFRR